MGIPYTDSTASATFEMSDIRFTGSHAPGNLNTTPSGLGPPEASLDAELCSQRLCRPDIEDLEVELDGLQGIAESTLSSSESIRGQG